jgi:hypothetical protein
VEPSGHQDEHRCQHDHVERIDGKKTENQSANL